MCKGPGAALQLLCPPARVALLCPGPEHPWVCPPTENSQAAGSPAPGSTWLCLGREGAAGAELQPPDKMRRRRHETLPAASPISCLWAEGSVERPCHQTVGRGRDASTGRPWTEDGERAGQGTHRICGVPASCPVLQAVGPQASTVTVPSPQYTHTHTHTHTQPSPRAAAHGLVPWWQWPASLSRAHGIAESAQGLSRGWAGVSEPQCGASQMPGTVFSRERLRGPTRSRLSCPVGPRPRPPCRGPALHAEAPPPPPSAWPWCLGIRTWGAGSMKSIKGCSLL